MRSRAGVKSVRQPARFRHLYGEATSRLALRLDRLDAVRRIISGVVHQPADRVRHYRVAPGDGPNDPDRN